MQNRRKTKENHEKTMEIRFPKTTIGALAHWDPAPSSKVRKTSAFETSMLLVPPSAAVMSTNLGIGPQIYGNFNGKSWQRIWQNHETSKKFGVVNL